MVQSRASRKEIVKMEVVHKISRKFKSIRLRKQVTAKGGWTARNISKLGP